MLRFVCLLALFMMPLSAHTEEYNPSAPSAGTKATDEAAKSMVPDTQVVTPSENSKPSKTPPMSDKDKFVFFDKNKNGFLSYKEFVKYAGRTKPENISLQKRFLNLDKNGDYKLSEKELKGLSK